MFCKNSRKNGDTHNAKLEHLSSILGLLILTYSVWVRYVRRWSRRSGTGHFIE